MFARDEPFTLLLGTSSKSVGLNSFREQGETLAMAFFPSHKKELEEKVVPSILLESSAFASQFSLLPG